MVRIIRTFWITLLTFNRPFILGKTVVFRCFIYIANGLMVMFLAFPTLNRLFELFKNAPVTFFPPFTRFLPHGFLFSTSCVFNEKLASRASTSTFSNSMILFNSKREPFIFRATNNGISKVTWTLQWV